MEDSGLEMDDLGEGRGSLQGMRHIGVVYRNTIRIEFTKKASKHRDASIEGIMSNSRLLLARLHVMTARSGVLAVTFT